MCALYIRHTAHSLNSSCKKRRVKFPLLWTLFCYLNDILRMLSVCAIILRDNVGLYFQHYRPSYYMEMECHLVRCGRLNWSWLFQNVVPPLVANHCLFVRSTSKSRPNNIRRGKNVRPYVRPSTKSFFDFNEIWYIGRGRWLMHDGMLYGRIQGQGQGHEPLKVWIPSIFKTYLLRHLQWELANDH